MARTTASTETSLHAVNLCVRTETRSLIDRAAKALGRTRSDFMIEAAKRAAEDAILDQGVIVTDKESYDRFLAILDAPPQSNDALRKTMQATPLWERK